LHVFREGRNGILPLEELVLEDVFSLIAYTEINEFS
jgi:hypothetical protein